MTTEKVAYADSDTHRYIHVAEIDSSVGASNPNKRGYFSDQKRQVGLLRIKDVDGGYYEPALWNFVGKDVDTGVHRRDTIQVRFQVNIE